MKAYFKNAIIATAISHGAFVAFSRLALPEAVTA
jgi:hypothetical protein